jgi:hypothetical protein
LRFTSDVLIDLFDVVDSMLTELKSSDTCNVDSGCSQVMCGMRCIVCDSKIVENAQ